MDPTNQVMISLMQLLNGITQILTKTLLPRNIAIIF